MLDQQIAHLAASARENREQSFGQTGRLDDTRQFERDQRRPRGRFEQHGIARRKCGRHLLGIRCNRRVPRRDRRDKSQRLVDREGKIVATRRRQRIIEALQSARIIAERTRGRCDKRRRLPQRLAGVARLDMGNARSVVFDAFGNAIEVAGAFMGLEIAPCRIGLRPKRPLYGPLAIGPACTVDDTVDRSVGRKDRGDLRASALFPASADEKLGGRQFEMGHMACSRQRLKISRATE